MNTYCVLKAQRHTHQAVPPVLFSLLKLIHRKQIERRALDYLNVIICFVDLKREILTNFFLCKLLNILLPEL